MKNIILIVFTACIASVQARAQYINLPSCVGIDSLQIHALDFSALTESPTPCDDIKPDSYLDYRVISVCDRKTINSINRWISHNEDDNRSNEFYARYKIIFFYHSGERDSLCFSHFHELLDKSGRKRLLAPDSITYFAEKKYWDILSKEPEEK